MHQVVIQIMVRTNITTQSASDQISQLSALKSPLNRVNTVRKSTYLLAMDAIIIQDWNTITEGLTCVEQNTIQTRCKCKLIVLLNKSISTVCHFYDIILITRISYSMFNLKVRYQIYTI